MTKDSPRAQALRGPWVWAAMAIVVAISQLPVFVGAMWPPRNVVSDFYQDWASARNRLNGLPIYADHLQTIPRYIGEVDPACLCNRVNAHPPTSVLLLLPFAALDYRPALVAWNLVSLAGLALSVWLVLRELETPFSGTAALAAMTLLMVCRPLIQQLFHGQLNLALLVLITGAWIADRSGRSVLAGTLVGLATAIKLFPGFLFLYFSMRKRWESLASGAVTLALTTALTMTVLGPESYRSYVQEVLPQLQKFRSSWFNASAVGFWIKLFDPATAEERVEPLWRSVAVAEAGIAASWLGVLVLLARSLRRPRSSRQLDHAYGVAVTGMLLLSPITWDYAFLLLLIPVAVLGKDPPGSEAGRFLLMVALAALWFWQKPLCQAIIPGGILHGVARPVHTLTVLSYPCYALLIILILGASRAAEEAKRG